DARRFRHRSSEEVRDWMGLFRPMFSRQGPLSLRSLRAKDQPREAFRLVWRELLRDRAVFFWDTMHGRDSKSQQRLCRLVAGRQSTRLVRQTGGSTRPAEFRSAATAR